MHLLHTTLSLRDCAHWPIARSSWRTRSHSRSRRSHHRSKRTTGSSRRNQHAGASARMRYSGHCRATKLRSRTRSRHGRVERTGVMFADDEEILVIIDRLVAPLGRRLDLASPIVDARLPDGSRVHAVIPPISLAGPIVSIRRFTERPLSPDDLVRLG